LITIEGFGNSLNENRVFRKSLFPEDVDEDMEDVVEDAEHYVEEDMEAEESNTPEYVHGNDEERRAGIM